MSDQQMVRIRYSCYATERLSIDDVCRLLGTTRPIVERMIDEEIIRPAEQSGQDFIFEPESLGAIERSIRLHEDLGVNWNGVAIIQELLERMKRMRREMDLRMYRGGETLEGESHS